VYVVFNTLDKYLEQEQKDILSFITSIITVLGLCCVKVFVTSWREIDIAKAFKDRRIPTIPIQANNVAANIEAFVRS
jgi:predicted transposase YbfD/YdcC